MARAANGTWQIGTTGGSPASKLCETLNFFVVEVVLETLPDSYCSVCSTTNCWERDWKRPTFPQGRHSTSLASSTGLAGADGWDEHGWEPSSCRGLENQ